MKLGDHAPASRDQLAERYRLPWLISGSVQRQHLPKLEPQQGRRDEHRRLPVGRDRRGYIRAIDAVESKKGLGGGVGQVDPTSYAGRREPLPASLSDGWPGAASQASKAGT